MLENKHYKFQSTLLQEERHGSKESKKTKAPISIHAPTRGATADALQNKPEWEISIHAPTRGATLIWQKNITQNTISIHAPTRGATVYKCRIKNHIFNFNPRSYKRSDFIHTLCIKLNIISIHAPTRGATHSCRTDRSNNLISIHAPTRGATLNALLKNPYVRLFQSTLLQEERLLPFLKCQNRRIYFNPRSYKRSDYLLVMSSRSYYYFNPRSYKRSDEHSSSTIFLFQNFNPRSYKRSDYLLLRSGMHPKIFQSTLLQEERRVMHYQWMTARLFQSTLLQEERHYIYKIHLYLIIFQSTLLQEERHSVILLGIV